MIAALIGVLLVLLVTYKTAEHHGLDEIHMLFMMLFSFLGVVVFGHVLYGITKWDEVIDFFTHLDKVKSFDRFIAYMSYLFGGSVFYGGLIGAILTVFLYTKIKKLSFGDYSDVAALAIPLFHFFGRMGCFLSGCCYGVEWEHGITYHYSPIEMANGVPRFPVQLVEAVLNLLLFFFLYLLYKKGKSRHKILALYLLIYPVYRFILEFFRGDSYRGFLFGLSTSQLISVILFTISAVWMTVTVIREKRKKKTQPQGGEPKE